MSSEYTLLGKLLRFTSQKCRKAIIKYMNVLYNYSFTCTSNTYCIRKLLYIIVIHYQNKTLYNRVFLATYFMVLLMFTMYVHRPHPKFNNKSKVDLVWYLTQCNSLFSDFPGFQIYMYIYTL